MATRTIKTNECLNYMQSALATQTPIHLSYFLVSSTVGDLDPNRTINNINPTWYQGSFSESALADANQQLKVFVDIPSGLSVPASSYIREVYVIGTFNGTEFLFSITQLTGREMPYVSDAGYYFTLVYKLNSLASNPDLFIVDTERNYVITLGTNWTARTDDFYQDVTLAGLNSFQRPIIGLVQSDDAEVASSQRNNYAKITRAVGMNDAIRFYCETETEMNLTLQVKVFNEQE